MRRPDGQPPHFVSDGSQYLAHNQPATSSDPREENTIVASPCSAPTETVVCAARSLADGADRLARAQPTESGAPSENTALSFRDRAVIPSRPCDTGCFGLQRS